MNHDYGQYEPTRNRPVLADDGLGDDPPERQPARRSTHSRRSAGKANRTAARRPGNDHPLAPGPQTASPDNSTLSWDSFGTPKPKRITQSLLKELRRLNSQHIRRDRLRQELVDLLESRAAIEPGPLTVNVHPQTIRMLTADNLTQILGRPAVEDLLRRITPTMQTCVRIVSVTPLPDDGLE